MAKAPRAGFFDYSTGPGANRRQAQRDAAAGDSLTFIAQTLSAILQVAQVQANQQAEIIRLLHEQNGQPRP